MEDKNEKNEMREEFQSEERVFCHWALKRNVVYSFVIFDGSRNTK